MGICSNASNAGSTDLVFFFRLTVIKLFRGSSGDNATFCVFGSSPPINGNDAASSNASSLETEEDVYLDMNECVCVRAGVRACVYAVGRKGNGRGK